MLKYPEIIPCLRKDATLTLQLTNCLASLLNSLKDRIEQLDDVLKRFIIYIPEATAPIIQPKVYHPNAYIDSQDSFLDEELTEKLKPAFRILHPIITSMSTQFPDPRLIQYDCGKLQVLDW